MKHVFDHVRPRTLGLIAVAALLLFTPAVVAKGQRDGWGLDDLPFIGESIGAIGVDGEQMADVCETVPPVGLEIAEATAVLTFGSPIDGIALTDAEQRLRAMGVDVDLRVTAEGIPASVPPDLVSRIDGNVSSWGPMRTGITELVDADGLTEGFELPIPMEGQLWLTLRCSPARSLGSA